MPKPDRKQLGWVMFFLIGSTIPMFALLLRRDGARTADEDGLTPLGAVSATASVTASASASTSASASDWK